MHGEATFMSFCDVLPFLGCKQMFLLPSLQDLWYLSVVILALLPSFFCKNLNGVCRLSSFTPSLIFLQKSKMFSMCTMMNTQAITPLISRPTETYHPRQNLKPRNNTLLQVAPASFYFPSTPSTQGLGQRSFVSRSTEGSSLVRCSSENPVLSGEDDHRALETVLKLYKAIKHRNLRELSDVIGDECRCVCNFISFPHLCHGKEQVLELFNFLVGSLGKNIELVVRPTMHEGLDVGIAWKLEWKTTHMPLGKGISFHTVHIYQGKVLIKSIEMFMEPLLNIEPLRLKLMGFVGFVMSLLDKIGSEVISKGRRWKLRHIILSLVALLIFALLIYFRSSWF